MQIFVNRSKFRKWSRRARSEIRRIIFVLLKEYKYGITIIDLSKELNLSRKVVSEEVHKLAKNKIRIRRVGNCILCYRKQYYKI